MIRTAIKWLLVNPYVLAALLALSAAGIGYVAYTYYHAVHQVTVLTDKLKDANAQIAQVKANDKANDEAVATRKDIVVTINVKEAQGRAATIKALEAHPEWANERIPADVLDSLRDEAPAGVPDSAGAGLPGNSSVPVN